MSPSILLWPTAASRHADEVDLLIGTFGGLVALLTIPVFVLMTVFAIRYRTSREADREHPPSGRTWLEFSWAGIPFLLILGFFFWSTQLFFQIHRPPPGAMTINVVAKQWMWKFQHAQGAAEINELHVPAGRPVRLNMTSRDVIHSLFLPAFRIKQDLLPGRYTSLWFQAREPGIYAFRCAEFCGTDHSVMGGRLVVMRPADFAAWLEEEGAFGTSATLAELGGKLFREVGCSGCHGPASDVHAPNLAGLFGRPVGLSDGSTIVADEQYLHDSIMLPNKHIAAGYQPIMPTYGNVLEPEQVNALVAFIRAGAQAQEEEGP
ncbi:cytochrome c oxidase subunit II [Novosphingobium sp. M1R2S20]|uniref:cytochrome-c oxidase n=1 Tax=Novosphingobium rhizovicinum TaxID=3228928 RepID=A0ABV3RGF9_9SPHN